MTDTDPKAPELARLTDKAEVERLRYLLERVVDAEGDANG